MIAVIFEVRPNPGQIDRYLGIAANLHPILERTDGFLSVERFQSLTNPGKILSLSFFEDEASVQRWRQTGEHRAAQSAGRDQVFEDYRLRVAQVTRDYSMESRGEVPEDSLRHQQVTRQPGFAAGE